MQPANQKYVERPIVFYDGECGLCDQFVQFMLRRDSIGAVQFAALQGETYQRTAMPVLGPADMTTVVLWESGTAYTHSDAVLRATRHLGGATGCASSLAMWVPRAMRNLVYRFVSRNRYRWFGTVDACRVPTGDERERFLP